MIIRTGNMTECSLEHQKQNEERLLNLTKLERAAKEYNQGQSEYLFECILSGDCITIVYASGVHYFEVVRYYGKPYDGLNTDLIAALKKREALKGELVYWEHKVTFIDKMFGTAVWAKFLEIQRQYNCTYLIDNRSNTGYIDYGTMSFPETTNTGIL
jgi:hypothetical protein